MIQPIEENGGVVLVVCLIVWALVAIAAGWHSAPRYPFRHYLRLFFKRKE